MRRERVLHSGSLLEARDWTAVRELLIGEDEAAAEARHVTVFLGIISQARRQEIVDEVVARTMP